MGGTQPASEPGFPVLPELGGVVGELRLPRASEQIADRMLAAIAVGVLQSGDRLPTERQLADQLGVSRTTVRHALGQLVALGVVETRRGRTGGTYIRRQPESVDGASAVLRTLEPVWQEMESLLDYRTLVQELIARTAAERHTQADREEIRRALDAYRAASGARQSRGADHALHTAVARASGNPYLVDLGNRLIAAVNLGFRADPYSEELHDRALRQHERLITGVLDGDGDAAAAAAREHFHVTSTEPWRSLVRAARQRGERSSGER